MSLRRRLSIVAVLGALVAVGGMLTAVPGAGGRRSAQVLVSLAVSVAGVAVSALAVRARLTSAAPDPEDELARTRDAFHLALSRLGKVLGATHDEDRIIEAIVEVALLVIPGECAIYFRPGGVPGRIHATHAVGLAPADERIPGLQLDGSGLAGTAAMRLQLVVLGPQPLPPDASSLPLGGLDPREPTVRAGVAVPLFGGGRLVGVLAVYGATVERHFSLDEVGLLVSLLRQAEVAINNVEVHLQVRREALTDGVTGLWNRRQFDIRLREAVAASQRFGEPFGVAVFDLDDFKRINDTWDHLTGDAALVHFAAVLRSTTRDVDLSCRWGGEEFAVLFQRSPPEDVAMVVQRLIDTLRDTPLTIGDQTIPFTVSAGVASYPSDGSTAQQVFAAADAALLRAKAGGKDRLERASLDLDPGQPPLATTPPSPPVTRGALPDDCIP